jgi:hypothetical protein
VVEKAVVEVRTPLWMMIAEEALDGLRRVKELRRFQECDRSMLRSHGSHPWSPRDDSSACLEFCDPLSHSHQPHSN